MNHNHPKAAIFGIQGTQLTSDEEKLFAAHNPFGFILFERNCQNHKQILDLVSSLKAIVGRDDVPILIDQEGGRVQRLKPPIWKKRPTARSLADLTGSNPQTNTLIRDNSWLIGKELKELNITVNCAPVADVPLPDAHPIIGDRAYGTQPSLVTKFCLDSIEGYTQSGITCVIKHIPGHGRAMVDSHENLPIVDTDRATLLKTDFLAFLGICNYFNGPGSLAAYPWGMTAHVVYSAIDDQLPATFSKTVIDAVIRGYIGFEGFLISDCLTMKALSGSYSDRARKAMQAGCDAVLHCSGNLQEMTEICESIGSLSTNSYQRYLRSKPQRNVEKTYVAQSLEDKINESLGGDNVIDSRVGQNDLPAKLTMSL